MKHKSSKLLSFFFLFILLFGILYIPSTGALSNVDSWNYEDYTVGKVIQGLKITYLYNNILAISYGNGGSNYVNTKTFTCSNTTGLITNSFVDTEAENSGFGSAYYPSNLVLYANHTYAMAYKNEYSVYPCWIVSYLVGSNGALTDKGAFQFENSNGYDYQLCKIENSHYMAIAYLNPSSDGIIKTISFNSNDVPTAITDTWNNFDDCGSVLSFSHLSNNKYLIVYKFGTTVNFKIFNIDTNGVITKSFTETYSLSSVGAFYSSWLSDNIFGVAYTDVLTDIGYFNTIGVIETDIYSIDSMAFNFNVTAISGISVSSIASDNTVDIVYVNDTSSIFETICVDKDSGTIYSEPSDDVIFYSALPSNLCYARYSTNYSAVAYYTGVYPSAYEGYIETLGQIGNYTINETGGSEGYDIDGCPDGFSDSIGATGYYNIRESYSDNFKYLFTSYFNEEQFTIGRVSLQLDYGMLSYSYFSTNSVYMKVNEYDIGYPNRILRTGNKSIVLQWDTYIVVNKTTVLFGWKLITPDGYTPMCWNLQYFNTGIDINNDGTNIFGVAGNSYDGFFNSFNEMWQESHYYTDPYSAYQYFTISSDLPLRLCIDRLGSGVNEYTNDIIISPLSAPANSTFDITYFFNSASLGYNRSITVDCGINPYTYYPQSQTGTIFYTPIYPSKTYKVNLSIDNAVVITKTFSTTSVILNNFIYTEPNPSNAMEYFTVHYKYAPTVLNGIIQIKDSDGVLVKHHNILANTSGEYTEILASSGLYTVELCQLVDAEPYMIASNKHIVGTIFSNFLKLESVKGIILEFSGQHSHIGEDVMVKVGHTYSTGVGATSPFTLTFHSLETGILPYSLVLNTGGKETLLYFGGYVTVTDTGGSGTGGDITDNTLNFFTSLPFFIKLILALIIIVLLTLLPAILSALLGRRNITIDIPALVYVAFFLVGVVTSILIGLLEYWILFFMLFALIIVFAITWIQRKIAE